jgi:hypothetical protein
VTYFAQNYPAYGWAILMAGGSCPTLRIADEALRRAIPQMTEIRSDKESYRLLGERGGLVYLPQGAKVEVALPDGTYALKQIDQRTGEVKTLVKALAKKGMTVLTTSHLLADSQDICDRVMILNRGKCAAEGKVSELGESLEDFFLAKVGSGDDFALADFLS